MRPITVPTAPGITNRISSAIPYPLIAEHARRKLPVWIQAPTSGAA